MRETVIHLLIIVFVSSIVFFLNLGQSRLWDRDEPRNAGCAIEMMDRGDLVVPTFNDELRHQKPVLLYWLMMTAYSMFGVSEFSARFWSALLGIGTVVATYFIGCRLANARVGLISAIALSTSLMFVVAARAATPDSVLIFCGTVALMFYVLGTFPRRAEQCTSDSSKKTAPVQTWFPGRLTFVLGIYVMLGFGVLAKGPVGFVVPMAIVGMFMLIQRLEATPRSQRSDASLVARTRNVCSRLINQSCRTFHPVHFARTLWAMRPIMGTMIVLTISVPWFCLVGIKTEGVFLEKFFVGEHFGRATTSFENHSGGIWFYPLAILIGFFPWSVFWGPVMIDTKSGRKSRANAATTFVLCWIGVQVGIFTLAQTKLPSYVTPCYPALAILTGMYVDRIYASHTSISRRWLIAALTGLVLSGGFISIALWFATNKFMPNQSWLALLGLIPLLAGGLCIWLTMTDKTQRVPTVFSISCILFCVALFGFGPSSLDREQQADRITSLIANQPSAVVGSFGCLESSWVLYGHRTIFELVESATEPGSSNQPFDSKGTAWNPKKHPTITEFACRPNAFIITTDEHIETVKKRLPEDFEVIQTAEYFLKNRKLVLLGRPTPVVEAVLRKASLSSKQHR